MRNSRGLSGTHLKEAVDDGGGLEGGGGLLNTGDHFSRNCVAVRGSTQVKVRYRGVGGTESANTFLAFKRMPAGRVRLK